MDKLGLRMGEIARILELTMQHHLPVPFPDGITVMCLCHTDGGDALFEGPVNHRKHVALQQIEALEEEGWL